MKEYILILFAAVFANNYVLSKTLGICPFLGVSKKFNQALGMGVAVTFVMVLATAATWPIQRFVLDPLGVGYLQTIAFILVIAALVQFVEIILKRFIPSLHRSLGVYLPLITTNCAVLDVAIANIDAEYTFFSALLNALGGGVGFLFAMVMFAGVRSRLEDDERVPRPFRGLPVTLIAAAIVSLSFMAFNLK
ncbi:MAG: RnfABCDGE type electron transport complex subunit A [Clostridia bacterium]|nr:RnfABCDGE type electron transport complex subunit A [Clostridia bacterium]